MANLKVLDGDAATKYLSTDGAGTDADPHVSHHVLDENTDGVYIGDIKFGESLLAGTNAIGKLAANSGVDIGDVTINNAAGSGVYVRPGTSATWDVSDRAARLVGQVYGSQSTVLQQKVTTNDLIVTLDGETVSVTESSPISGFATSAKQLADGHNVTVDNAANAGVYVQEGTSASWNIRALTNSDVVSAEQSTAASLNCTEASASNILTAVQLIDDPVAVLGTATYAEATTSAFVIGAVRNDTLATLVNTDNEIAPLQVDASGALYVNLSGEGIDMNVEGVAAENANAAGNPVLVGGRYDVTPRTLGDTDVGAIALDADGAIHISDGGNTITVDGSVTADTELPAAGALGDAMNNPTTPLLGACLMGWDSVAGKWERCKTDASNYLKVDASVATVTVTGDAAGSLTVDQATHDSFNCNANLQQGDTDVASDNELYVRGSGTAGSPDAAILTIQGVGSMTPVIVTGDSAGSLTVDQATAANLKATVYGAGSAGSADAGVMTIQGIGSMTPILATLQASDGTDIGNVDIASASFEKAEDAGHSTGDKGVMALAVRHDTISSLCGADLDYTPLQVDATGYLYTKDKNAASLAVVGGGAESTALRVTIANDSTGILSVDDGGGTLTVDGTVTATPSGIQEIEGDEAEGSGNLPQPVLIGGDDGTDIKNINVDATTGDVQVDVTNQVDAGGATPVVTPVTGSASPFSTSYAPSADFWLESITLHLSAAGTTSEAFTVTLNATDGGAYDTLLFSQDLSKGAITDLVWVPEGGPMLFENSDALDIAWNNEEDRTYGLRLVTRLA